MEDLRKSETCLNCGNTLAKAEKYCPECGQENKDKKVPVGVFLEELIASLLSFDGRFLRTLSAFFFQPGKLTIAFNNGQRRKYTHPIRLYLLFSLFYFFMIGYLIPKDLLDQILNSANAVTSAANAPEFEDAISELDPVDSSKLVIALEKVGDLQLSYVQDVDSLSNSTKKNYTWKELRFMSIDPSVSEEAFSQAVADSPFTFDLGLSPEKKRAFIAHSNLFISQVAKNLPLMMLLLLPIFALFVHLLFAGKQVFYIENLILGLHLHALAYAVYGLVILLSFWGDFKSSWYVIGAFVLVTTYSYVALLKIYRQHWFKTLVKFWILGGLYLLVLSTGMAFELYLSLLFL